MHTQSTTVDFGLEIRRGLGSAEQKWVPAKYLYDEVGSALFDAITVLPEYGLTRADVRLLRDHSPSIAEQCLGVTRVVELGSGNGLKTSAILSSLPPSTVYHPIDLSPAALASCRNQLPEFQVEPIESDFLHGLEAATALREPHEALLVLFLGSNIGNFGRNEIPNFLSEVRARLRPGDSFLIGADLMNDVGRLLLAYDDPAGVTAAFNRNLLARLNRVFDGDFDLRCFDHEARWKSDQRRIEMHLRARTTQHVHLNALNFEALVQAGESIHTESSHKFELPELVTVLESSGFTFLDSWNDQEWPFVEILVRTSEEPK